MNSNKKKWFSTPYVLWSAIFIIVPLLMIIYYGLTSKNGGFDPSNLALITEDVYRRSLWLSIKLSFISTVVCLVLSYPLAMILKGKNIKNNNFIITIFILPMWMNFLLRTIAWQNILEKNGLLNSLLNFLNLPSQHWINTPTAIVIGMVYNFLPFMILPIYNSLIKIDQNVINAARDLGANTFYTFTRVILPLSMPGVISGITMVFVPSLTTFAISTILGGSKINLIGNLIEQKFLYINNWHAGSGLSLVLMIIILLTMAIVNKYDKETEGSNEW